MDITKTDYINNSIIIDIELNKDEFKIIEDSYYYDEAWVTNIAKSYINTRLEPINIIEPIELENGNILITLYFN